MNDINIHGDNIVECERTLNLILQSFIDEIEDFSFINTSVACPQFSLKFRKDDTPKTITFFPGFGRWEKDILSAIRDRGNILREAPDVIVTEVRNNEENPLFAIEFCGALPAGNQAWQRNGRAYSYGTVKIPYLYISELGGYELDKNRNRKAPRLPNPAVPFSYLSFSIENETPVFPVFITAPGADQSLGKLYEIEFSDTLILDFVKSVLLKDDLSKILYSLQDKILSFIKKKAEASRSNETLSASEWQKAYEKVRSGESISNFLIKQVRQKWSKTAYIRGLTEKTKKLISFAKAKGIGLTSTKLPICLLDTKGRNDFIELLNSMYPNLNADFKNWLQKDEPLGICWIMGFKPRGDDARPDRGLAPFARMLLGANHDLLSIVYGPAPQTTWYNLEDNPIKLINKNGLWESILKTSNAILIESTTDQNITRKGYTSLHWHCEHVYKKPTPLFVPSRPKKYGEHDVDTAIHILLTKLCNKKIFEGMCNPPGGDWSGVSILLGSNELRWVSLPKVSGPSMKRPDHVFQFFIEKESPIILSIESKEFPNTLESNIGPKLTKYLLYLFESKASIERAIGTSQWSHSNTGIEIEKFQFASAGAFLSKSAEKNNAALTKANTDLNFSVTFRDNGKKCNMDIYTRTLIGKKLAKYIHYHLSKEDLINVSIISSEINS